MSFIKRLDDISETKERSKTLSEAISKVEEAMAAMKERRAPAKSNRVKGEKEEA